MPTSPHTKATFLPALSTRAWAIAALVFISISWGTTWVASRHAVRFLPVFQLAAIRQLIAGLLFLVFFALKKSAWPVGRQWLDILILGLLNLFLTNGLTTWAIKYISAGLGAIIAAIFPLWLVLFGLFGSARMQVPNKAIWGLFLGFLGVCLVFYDHLAEFFQPDFRFGILLSLVASLSWALGSLYTKKHAAVFNPYFSIGLQMLGSGIAFYSISQAAGNNVPFNQIPQVAWMDLIYLVIVGSALSFLAYLYALQSLPTQQVSVYAYINPVVAVLLGSWFFGEKLSLLIGLGGGVALYGVYLVNDSFRKSSRGTAP